MGTPPNKVRPTPPPRGSVLARSTTGVLILALGGTAGVACNKNNPPMHEPQPPMPEPPMDDPGDPPMVEPMEEPSPDEDAVTDEAAEGEDEAE